MDARSEPGASLDEEASLRHLVDEARRDQARDRRLLVSSLHDNILQVLLALRWQVEDLDDGSRPEVGAAVTVQLDALVDDVWELIGALHPAFDPDENDRADDLVRQLTLLAHPTPLSVDLYGFDRLTTDHQILVARICREAVDNTARHARATLSGITLRPGRHGRFWLRCTDNGAGCPPEQLTERRATRSGLRELDWAVHRRGGRLRLRNRPGSGFSLHVLLHTDPPTLTRHP
jgi:signal transduction histidine kinase